MPSLPLSSCSAQGELQKHSQVFSRVLLKYFLPHLPSTRPSPAIKLHSGSSSTLSTGQIKLPFQGEDRGLNEPFRRFGTQTDFLKAHQAIHLPLLYPQDPGGGEQRPPKRLFTRMQCHLLFPSPTPQSSVKSKAR